MNNSFFCYFYDFSMIDKIVNKVKSFTTKCYIKSIPYFNIDHIKNIIDETIIRGSNLDDNIKNNYGEFGVECYVIDDNRAILLGAITSKKLFK